MLQGWRNDERHGARSETLAEFGNATGAMLLYDMQLPMTEVRVAEHFTVSDGLIMRIREIHDTFALRTAGARQLVAQ